MHADSDTIFALSTGVGKAAVAIVRVSGPHCDEILRRLCRRSTWPERTAIHTGIYDEAGVLVDKGLVLTFAAPRSFTGEAMIEFQVTGGRAVKTALLKALAACPNTRPAEAGEFARRAFANGKMDLVQVEGLAAIVEAETIAAARHSALMAFGQVSQQCEQAREDLIKAASLVEGLLDFSDIEDPSGVTLHSVRQALEKARGTLEALLRKGRVTERLRDGFQVAIVGAPNAGKSSLINHILEREAAIVSDIPGTTRDFLEFFVELGGYPVVFIDTAGFRDTLDPIERIGVERSKRRVGNVDLIILLADGLHDCEFGLPEGVPVLRVRSKADIYGHDAREGVIPISSITGNGVESLLKKITARASAFFSDASDAGLGTERQRFAVAQAIAAIDRAGNGVEPEELVAEDIRAALTALGRVTGRVDVEDVLDEVFSRLCVGK